MKYCFLLFLCCAYLQPLLANSTLPFIYFQALKTNNPTLLEPYFYTQKEAVADIGLGNDPFIIASSVLDQERYHKIVQEGFEALTKTLQTKGFSLEKCVLHGVQRGFGTNGLLELTLKEGAQERVVYVEVMERKGQDYLTDQAPSLLPFAAGLGEGTLFINNKKYQQWDLRGQDRFLAAGILQTELPLTVEGGNYSTCLVTSSFVGIKTLGENKNKIVAIRMLYEDTTRLVSYVDLVAQTITETVLLLPVDQKKPNSIQTNLDARATELASQKAPTFQTKFQKVQQERDSLLSFINGLRKELAERSPDGYYTKEGSPIPNNRRDKETPHLIFIEEGKGVVLQQKIIHLHESYLQLIESRDKREVLRATLPLDLSAAEARAKASGKTWASYTFGHMPIAAIWPMLRAYAVYIEREETMIVEYLLR